MKTAALVFGILGIVFLGLVVPLGVVAMGLAIACTLIALVLGVIERRSGAGKAGLVLGILGLLGTALFVLMFSGKAVETSRPVAVTSTSAVPPLPRPDGG